MSAKAIIEQLKRLCVLHEHLLTLSEEKTEALKAGKTKELSNILTKEQKYIQAITQTEDDRIKTTSVAFSDIAKIILFPHVSPKPQAVKRKSWNNYTNLFLKFSDV